MKKEKFFLKKMVVNKLAFIIFFIFSIILALFVIAYFIFPEINLNSNNKISNSNSSINCGNLSLIDTSICLNDYVKDIWKYRITPDNVRLSLEELKIDGGDCLDYVRFYEEYFNYYGFKTKRITLPAGEEEISNQIINMKHTFLIVNDDTGYCLLDMKNRECYEYDRKN